MPDPPQLFLRFFRWFCNPRLVRPIEGDLMELYRTRVDLLGKRKADRLFVKDVLLLFRKDIIRPVNSTYQLNPYGMLKHNLVITFRSFKRHRSSFLINLLGLTAGLTTFLLIYLWVNDELQKDQFHRDPDQIYQVMRTLTVEGRETFTTVHNSSLLASSLEEELPEVEMAVPVADEFSYAVLSVGDKKLKSDGKFVGKDFFNLFSFNLVDGDEDQVLVQKESIVISRQLVDMFFPDISNPIGQSLHLMDNTDGEAEYEGDYVVTGVFDNSGLNTSMEFDFLLPNSRFVLNYDQSSGAWDSNNPSVYIKLPSNLDMPSFEEKLSAFYVDKMAAIYGSRNHSVQYNMHLQPYTTRYLHNLYENGALAGGRIAYVYLFSVIGLLILLIACINFINLSTAMAARRSKEVGVKKVFGTRRQSIMGQYLLESGVVVGIAMVLSIGLLLLLLPRFNQMTGKTLTIAWDLNLVAVVLLIALVTSLLAGLYPAVFLSRLRPLKALVNQVNSSMSEVIVRKGLIIFQFAISMILVVSVIVVTSQMSYVQSKNLGYSRENIITIAKEGELVNDLGPFMTEIERIPGVVNATILEGNISKFDNQCGGYRRPNQPMIQFTFAYVGYNFIETVGLELKEGRSFSPDFGNEGQKIILNETAIATMELEDPVGKTVDIRGDREIIGVLKDFHYRSLHEAIAPMFLILEPDDATTIAIRIAAGDQKETIDQLEAVYREVNPGLPLEFTFLDDEYNALYRAEQKVADLSNYFASIAIIISCLGLFGLTAFVTERRIKEIGIRKVLGSTRIGIVSLLGNGMLRLLLVAIFVAVPLSYFLMGKWLENFAYRIDLTPGYFIWGALAAVGVALLTVSTQTWSAASANPVECLRDE
ncbi:MAG: ABC transporter permease [Bacteroidota bacterium]